MKETKKELEEQYGFEHIAKIEDELVSELASSIDREIVAEIFEMYRIEKERIAKLKADREEKINDLLDEKD